MLSFFHTNNTKEKYGKAHSYYRKNFNKELGTGVTILYFWAEWNRQCYIFEPLINELTEELDGKVKICKVNTDEQPNIVIKHGVRSVPTIMFFKDNKVVNTMVGTQSKSALLAKVEKLLE